MRLCLIWYLFSSYGPIDAPINHVEDFRLGFQTRSQMDDLQLIELTEINTYYGCTLCYFIVQLTLKLNLSKVHRLLSMQNWSSPSQSPFDSILSSASSPLWKQQQPHGQQGNKGAKITRQKPQKQHHQHDDNITNFQVRWLASKEGFDSKRSKVWISPFLFLSQISLTMMMMIMTRWLKIMTMLSQ